VKGVVGSASLVGIGTASAVTINATTEPSGAGGGIIQYYGVENTDGPDFRYTSAPPYECQQEEVESGDRVNVDDFSDYASWGNGIGEDGLGKPAMATWRSQDVPASGTMPVQIIRSTRIEEMADNSEWLSASTEEGFIANLNKCTHFCCVPAFKAYPGSSGFGAVDDIYCQCHQSVYDPFSIIQQSFVALPRPDDG